MTFIDGILWFTVFALDIITKIAKSTIEMKCMRGKISCRQNMYLHFFEKRALIYP